MPQAKDNVLPKLMSMTAAGHDALFAAEIKKYDPLSADVDKNLASQVGAARGGALPRGAGGGQEGRGGAAAGRSHTHLSSQTWLESQTDRLCVPYRTKLGCCCCCWSYDHPLRLCGGPPVCRPPPPRTVTHTPATIGRWDNHSPPSAPLATPPCRPQEQLLASTAAVNNSFRVIFDVQGWHAACDAAAAGVREVHSGWAGLAPGRVAGVGGTAQGWLQLALAGRPRLPQQ